MKTKLPRWAVEKIGRVAMRHEGKWYVAYYALPDTMAGALEIGRINFNAATDDVVRDAFVQLNRLIVSNIMFDALGVRPEWPEPPQPAPESERSGHA